jgi:hypothetical protein
VKGGGGARWASDARTPGEENLKIFAVRATKARAKSTLIYRRVVLHDVWARGTSYQTRAAAEVACVIREAFTCLVAKYRVGLARGR